jgi:hypothetical protein
MHLPPFDRDAAATSRAGVSGAGSSSVRRPTISLTNVVGIEINDNADIDPRSALEGGDATLLVPSHAIDLPTRPHRALHHEVHRTQTGTYGPNTVPSRTARTAAIRRAVGVYQHYGQPPPPGPAPPEHLAARLGAMPNLGATPSTPDTANGR